MPKEENQASSTSEVRQTGKNPNHGKALMEWSFPEFASQKRSGAWYFWIGLIIAGLMLYSAFTSNFLFAVIIMMTSAILYIQSKREPAQVSFLITADGLEIGNNFYEYKALKKFWIIYEPPEIKNLYLDFKTAFRPTLCVPLENQNPLAVRKNLLKYFDEDLEKTEEPFIDAFARRLKI